MKCFSLRLSISLVLLFLLGTLPVHTGAKNEQTWSDVVPGSLYAIPLTYLKEHQIVEGYPDGTFRPKDSVNRAEALGMILKAFGTNFPTLTKSLALNSNQKVTITLPKKTKIKIEGVGTSTISQTITQLEIEGSSLIHLKSPEEKKPFPDVTGSAWYADMVAYAKEQGIIRGYRGGLFQPESQITLAEALRMLLRSNSIKPEDPKSSELPPDVARESWYAPDIAFAVSRYALIPLENGNVEPNKKISRGELALVLYRYLKGKEGIQFGRASWYGDGLSKHVIPAAKAYMDRAHTAAHREFAFGSIVRVKNLSNGKTVDVVINDRGPFVPGRIIDLSKSSFAELASPTVGVISVEIELVSIAK